MQSYANEVVLFWENKIRRFQKAAARKVGGIKLEQKVKIGNETFELSIQKPWTEYEQPYFVFEIEKGDEVNTMHIPKGFFDNTMVVEKDIKFVAQRFESPSLDRLSKEHDLDIRRGKVVRIEIGRLVSKDSQGNLLRPGVWLTEKMDIFV
jgi:hypothetical protein